MPAHILTNFEAALRELRNNALMMASLTERHLEHARKGLFEKDEDWCNSVIADDEEIDSLEIQIDRDGLGIMLRFHPLASDLRNVITTMKLSVNLERIADQAVSIARRARKLSTRAPVPEVAQLDPIFQFSVQMQRDAIRSYADNDLDLARTLRDRDRELDRLVKAFGETITQLMAVNVDLIPSYMDLIFISRSLERIGDQAKGIGEDTIYAICAEDTRHTNRVDE